MKMPGAFTGAFQHITQIDLTALKTNCVPNDFLIK
jgi:hypothetical protein